MLALGENKEIIISRIRKMILGAKPSLLKKTLSKQQRRPGVKELYLYRYLFYKNNQVTKMALDLKEYKLECITLNTPSIKLETEGTAYSKHFKKMRNSNYFSFLIHSVLLSLPLPCPLFFLMHKTSSTCNCAYLSSP